MLCVVVVCRWWIYVKFFVVKFQFMMFQNVLMNFGWVLWQLMQYVCFYMLIVSSVLLVVVSGVVVLFVDMMLSELLVFFMSYVQFELNVLIVVFVNVFLNVLYEFYFVLIVLFSVFVGVLLLFGDRLFQKNVWFQICVVLLKMLFDDFFMIFFSGKFLNFVFGIRLFRFVI